MAYVTETKTKKCCDICRRTYDELHAAFINDASDRYHACLPCTEKVIAFLEFMDAKRVPAPTKEKEPRSAKKQTATPVAEA